MDQDSGFGLAASTVSQFCYAGIQVSVGAAVSSEPQMGKDLFPGPLRLLAEFIFS